MDAVKSCLPAMDRPMDEALLADALERVDVEFVLPVYNEELAVGSSVIRLASYLRGIEGGSARCPAFSWRIVVADNASTDETLAIARALAEAYPTEVGVLHLDKKGRGRALNQAWSAARARVVAYMDIDLSTDLAHVPDLIAPLLNGTAGVAIGSRLAAGARVTRSALREFTSRTYNALLHAYLHVGFSDAQCGFKAVRADVAARLLPQVRDTGWFFDTELLVLAERAGVRIAEVPVHWVEDPGSTVNVIDTAIKDIQGMRRMKHTACLSL